MRMYSTKREIRVRKANCGILNYSLGVLLLACWPGAGLMAQSATSGLNVQVSQSDGSYALAAPGSESAVLSAGVAPEPLSYGRGC